MFGLMRVTTHNRIFVEAAKEAAIRYEEIYARGHEQNLDLAKNLDSALEHIGQLSQERVQHEDDMRQLRKAHNKLVKALMREKSPAANPRPASEDFSAREELEDAEWDAAFQQSERALATTRMHDEMDAESAKNFAAAITAMEAAGVVPGAIEVYDN